MSRALLVLALLVSTLRSFAEIEIDQYGSARTVGQASYDSRPAARRVGLGLMTGGVSGIFGANLEINFTRRTGFVAGGGVSTDFKSLFIGGKHRLAGEDFSLYGSGGYARWFNNGSERQVGKTTPGFLGERFLNQSERERGIFAENLIYAGLGVQYFKSRGEWAGSSLYAEVIAIVDLDDLTFAPNAGLGYLFYF